MKSTINSFLAKAASWRRKKYQQSKAKRLKNRSFSLIASNCNGGVMLHELGMEFLSPFVNLWIPPSDFVTMCADLKNYMRLPIHITWKPELNYPVGDLGGLRLYFQHYATVEDAYESWNRRVGRIDFDNLFVLFTDRDGCTDADLRRFDELPWKKVVLCHVPHPSIKSCVYVPGFEALESVGMCMDYKNRFAKKRFYDCFDFVRWFNGDE